MGLRILVQQEPHKRTSLRQFHLRRDERRHSKQHCRNMHKRRQRTNMDSVSNFQCYNELSWFKFRQQLCKRNNVLQRLARQRLAKRSENLPLLHYRRSRPLNQQRLNSVSHRYFYRYHGLGNLFSLGVDNRHH